MPTTSPRTSLISADADQTRRFGERLGRTLAGGEIIALDAPLGAGKTVFAKGVASGLDVTETVTSPTYTIISEYSGRLRFVHVDLYRIESEDDYDQLAVDELVDAQTVVLIEWPDRAGSALPYSAIQIGIAIDRNGVRHIDLPEDVAPMLTGE